MSLLLTLASLNRLIDAEDNIAVRHPVDNVSVMNTGDWFAFRLNIDHMQEDWQPGRGYNESPIKRMVMSGSFDFLRGPTYIRDIGVWYDETTGRYFGFFFFDEDSRMYRLRRTDAVED